MTDEQEGDPQASARNPCRLVVVAASAGGIAALSEMLAALTGVFPAAVAIVQHRPPRAPSVLAHVLNRRSAMNSLSAIAVSSSLTPIRSTSRS